VWGECEGWNPICLRGLCPRDLCIMPGPSDLLGKSGEDHLGESGTRYKEGVNRTPCLALYVVLYSSTWVLVLELFITRPITKNNLLIYFQQSHALDISRFQLAVDPWGRKTPQEFKREWRKSWAARINDLFCPDLETWWMRREESDLTDWEAQQLADLESCGIRGWMC
jgi:hypothetical protein